MRKRCSLRCGLERELTVVRKKRPLPQGAADRLSSAARTLSPVDAFGFSLSLDICSSISDSSRNASLSAAPADSARSGKNSDATKSLARQAARPKSRAMPGRSARDLSRVGHVARASAVASL
jgi:hypothetical protein